MKNNQSALQGAVFWIDFLKTAGGLAVGKALFNHNRTGLPVLLFDPLDAEAAVLFIYPKS